MKSALLHEQSDVKPLISVNENVITQNFMIIR